MDTAVPLKNVEFIDEIKRVKFIAYLSFFFSGFQVSVYGISIVSESITFHTDFSMMIFYNSLPLWGQIFAMAAGGFLISRITARRTLIGATIFMILGSVGIAFNPILDFYILMSFFCNFATGLINVSCYHLIMKYSEYADERKLEGRFSLLNFFFNLGFIIGPLGSGFIIDIISWKFIFIIVSLLFLILMIVLLRLDFNETHFKRLSKQPKKNKIITPQFAMVIAAAFLFIYVIQIMNFFSQSYMQIRLGLNVKLVGILFSVYAISQTIGLYIIGKFLLSKIKCYNFIIVSLILFAFGILIFVHVDSKWILTLLMCWLGFVSSCIYPSILGYGLNMKYMENAGASSLILSVSSISIPIGTGTIGLISENMGSVNAMLAPSIILPMAVIFIMIANILDKKSLLSSDFV